MEELPSSALNGSVPSVGEMNPTTTAIPPSSSSVSTLNSTFIHPKQYGRVIISLENPILPTEMIERTPSMIDGLDSEAGTALRITGCRLIQLSGTLLKLPQTAMATAQVLFQRYYYSKSFVRFPMEYTSMACVVLASKVEEAPRRVRDIINVFNNIKQIRLKQPQVPMPLNEAYVTLKNQIIKMERRILKELGFCVHVKHPHKFIVTVAQILNNHENTELIQTAWNYMNDSLQTNVFVRYPPEAIACACIHLSSRILRVPLPQQPAWYLLFNTTTEAIEDICRTILTIYSAKLPSQEVLEMKVAEAKRLFDEAKAKAKLKPTLEANRLDGQENTMDSLDSRTNSPKVLPSTTPGETVTKDSLHNLSVINRLKQQSRQGQPSEEDSTPPMASGRLKSTVVMQENTSTVASDNSNKEDLKDSKGNNETNSRVSTPIAFKLEKSPAEDRRRRSSAEGSDDYFSEKDEDDDEERRKKHRGDDYEEDDYRDERRPRRANSRERYRNGDGHRHYHRLDVDNYDDGYRRRRSRSRDETTDYRYKSSYKSYKSHRRSPSPNYHSSSYHGKSSSSRYRDYDDDRGSGSRNRRSSRSRTPDRYRERDKYRGYRSSRAYR